MSLVESGQALPKLADSDETDELASRMREVAARLSSPSPAAAARTESPSVVSVPVLAEGSDPAVLESAPTPAGRSSTACCSTAGSSGRPRAASSRAT